MKNFLSKRKILIVFLAIITLIPAFLVFFNSIREQAEPERIVNTNNGEMAEIEEITDINNNEEEGIEKITDISGSGYEKLVFEKKGFKFRTLDEESVEIIYSGISSETKVLNIPASVNYNGKTYKVTSIGEMAFVNRDLRSDIMLEYSDWFLSELIIPEGITNIGAEAFADLNVSITIPESVAYIGNSAFDNYNDFFYSRSNLSVKLANVAESEDGFVIVNNILIKYNGNDSEVTIPDGITQIYAYAFSGCENLSVINFPDSVTYFGVDAFKDTPWLDNYPDDFVIINNVLIKYKGDNPDVIIPYGVTSIGDGAFIYIYSYQSDGAAILDAGLWPSIDGPAIESVIIPESVTYIGEAAFIQCNSLKYVEIPNSVTSIGYRAFCIGDADIKIPDSVTYIGAEAFSGTAPKNAAIPKGISYIGVLTFTNAFDEDEVLIIPEGVVCIDAYAFKNSRLEQLLIPKSIKYIHKDAFHNSEIENMIIYKDSNIDPELFRRVKIKNIIYK